MTCCGAGALLLILWVVLATALVVGTLLLWKTFSDGRKTNAESGTERKSRSLEILEARYARAEIDVEEFEERRRSLSSPADPD